MPESVTLHINGNKITVKAGSMVSAAIAHSGVAGFRRSKSGEQRGPLCGMGICFECRATIDGREHSLSCLIPCSEGMEVRTDA